jgi:hypothetical protein
MPSRDFERGSSHRLGTASTVNTGANAFTLAALVTVESLPGAAAYHAAIALNSATAAREIVLDLNGDTGPGTLALKVGATRVVPSTSIIPSTDGRWMILVGKKASGTVNADFMLYDFTTQTWTEFSTSGTVADRTAGATDMNVGSDGAANYWDGRIALAMYLPENVAKEHLYKLAMSRSEWYALFGGGGPVTRAYHSRQANQAGSLFDLTIPQVNGGDIDLGSVTVVYTTGTAPPVDGTPLPPGF